MQICTPNVPFIHFHKWKHAATDRIAHTTAFVTPVVEHWLEREIYIHHPIHRIVHTPLVTPAVEHWLEHVI